MSLKNRKVLVTGAAGTQGRAIVRQLLAVGATPRVLLRERGHNPFGNEVEIARGDLGDRGSLTRASVGSDAVALTLPQIQDRQAVVRYGRNVIDAAAAAGVPHIVYNGTGTIAAGTGVRAVEAKAEVMAHLNGSGVAYTVLRPTIYLENLLVPATVSTMIHQGVLPYPLRADIGVSWLSRDDVAAFVVAALERPRLAGSVFHIGGPDVLAGPELVRILSDATGRNISYVPVTAADFASHLNAVLGDGVGDEVAALYAWYDSQPVSPLAVNAALASEALGVQPQSVRAWAEAQPWQALAARAA